MNQEQIKVLIACAEEPGMAEAIVTESGLDLETVKRELKELEKKGFVYVDEDQFWATTLEGDNIYVSFKK